MAKIQINLDLDTHNPVDAELLGKLTVALGGNTYVSPVADAVDKGTIGGFKIEPRTAPLPENMEAKIDPYTAQANSAAISKVFSEEELKALPNDELKAMATELGIDWASAEGKNTNAKLAKLILRLQDKTVEEDIKEDNSDEEAYEANRSASGENTKEQPEKTTSNDVTIDELKVELGAKVDANRDAIVEKLNELGATKLTNLDESHYSEFMDFLKSL